LRSYQGNATFVDWVMVLQNLNSRLKNTRLEHTLSNTSLKAHLESHMRPDLHQRVNYKKISSGRLVDWIMEVVELDKELAEEWARTQAMINMSNAERTSKCKALIDRLSEPPSHASSTSSAALGTAVPRLKLAKLTDEEKKLLAKHQECMRCHTFYCDHPGTPDACPMKTANSWPDLKTTKTLTLAMALAAKPKSMAGLAYVKPKDEEEIRDEDTNEFYTYAIMSSLPDPPPFSAPHDGGVGVDGASAHFAFVIYPCDP
ncbi:hypothetical protein C0993_006419, partial [Termitomyces sp. T159_Od127]